MGYRSGEGSEISPRRNDRIDLCWIGWPDMGPSWRTSARCAASECEAKGVRSFLCSRSARPKKGLARRPQSNASHTLARLGDELEEGKQLRAQWEINWVTLNMRSVQAWREHHKQPRQLARTDQAVRLSGDRFPPTPPLIRAGLSGSQVPCCAPAAGSCRDLGC